MKHVKCPKCKSEIDSLRNLRDSLTEWEFTIDKNGDVDYYQTDVTETECGKYYCSACNALLFTSEEKAEAFLKGKKVKK